MDPQERSLRSPLRASARVLGLYARGAALLLLFQLACYLAGFALAQLPWWPLLAVLCAILGLIPHAGSLIGIAIVLALSAISGAPWTHLAIAAAAWLLTMAIETFWLAPRLLGKPLGLNALVVFVVLLVAGFLAGPIGLIVAVPILGIAMVWIRFFRRKPLLNE